MYGRFLGPLIALMLWQNCVWAAPFSAPGDRNRGPSVSGRSNFRPNNIPQRPQKQMDHSQDVEFRGYFYLNGMPRFCIYNVEAQFSEWITLGEATFEEFNASGFDLDSETLTVTFKNQSFNLNLYGPTSSPPSAPSLWTAASSRRTPPRTQLWTMALAVAADGSLFSFGSGDFGKLGQGKHFDCHLDSRLSC